MSIGAIEHAIRIVETRKKLVENEVRHIYLFVDFHLKRWSERVCNLLANNTIPATREGRSFFLN